MASLPTIPLVDVRQGGPIAHARLREEAARGLRDDCLAFFPPPLRPLLTLLDRVARRWLRRSEAPYVSEIEAISRALGFPGIWFLNNSYQWGCTTIAHRGSQSVDGDTAGAPVLARTLDWPFAGLGRRVEVARMAATAGEYFSVTWPGYVGVLTAMAPGRFGAAINQAPMWRRTSHPYLRPYDMAANALATWGVRHMPPDQLLRQVFETCTSFAQARAMLETTPIARPVIFTLAGVGEEEVCVIERTEESFLTRESETVVANDWSSGRPGWEARVAGKLLLTCSTEGAAENSRSRSTSLAGRTAELELGAFRWVTAPVLNPFTRMAVHMCPADGSLSVRGYEIAGGDELPTPATEILTLAPVTRAAVPA